MHCVYVITFPLNITHHQIYEKCQTCLKAKVVTLEQLCPAHVAQSKVLCGPV